MFEQIRPNWISTDYKEIATLSARLNNWDSHVSAEAHGKGALWAIAEKWCSSALAAHRIHYRAPVIAVILGTDALMTKTLEKWVFNQFREQELNDCEFWAQQGD